MKLNSPMTGTFCYPSLTHSHPSHPHRLSFSHYRWIKLRDSSISRLPHDDEAQASVPGLIVKLFTNSQRFVQFDSINPGDIYLLSNLKLVPVKKGDHRYLRCRSTATTKIRKITSKFDLQEGVQFATPVGWQEANKLRDVLSYFGSLNPNFLHKIESVDTQLKTYTGITNIILRIYPKPYFFNNRIGCGYSVFAWLWCTAFLVP